MSDPWDDDPDFDNEDEDFPGSCGMTPSGSGSAKLTLQEWLQERYANCLRHAENKTGGDREGWLEDADYYQQALTALTTAQNAHEEIQRLVARHTVLREACFQAWWGFTVLRGQRPESPDWTEPQRKAMRELDRLIKVTRAAKEWPGDHEARAI